MTTLGDNRPLITMLDSTVRKSPGKDALVYGEKHIPYEQLQAASRRAASVLRDAGVKPGDRVALMTFNTSSFVIAAFGISSQIQALARS